MFSATIPSDVEELAKSVLSTDFIRIIIGGSDSGNRSITQELMFAGTEDGKLIALKNLIKSGGLTPPALIFVQSIDRARDLNKELLAYNVKSDVMHSERSKEERDKIVKLFAAAKIWVLVCTDVMSRGVDFRGVQLVIKSVMRGIRKQKAAKSLRLLQSADVRFVSATATISHRACSRTSTGSDEQAEQVAVGEQSPCLRKQTRSTCGA